MSKIFEVEIGRPGSIGAMTATSLSLPATPFVLADALEKVRITDERILYSTEVLASNCSYLPNLIPASANLYELNHLAERLAALNKWELDCFEGLVAMDAAQGAESIPVERLINFTHSLENCQIAYEAHNDKSLGKFYVDNDMADLPDNLPEAIYELLDYEVIGRKARTAEGGVFIDKGYVVLNGEVSHAYREGSAVPPEKPCHTIELELCKGFFNDPDYDNDLSEHLLLPADDGIFDRAIAQVQAASMEECSLQAVDCIAPALTELLSDTLYESQGDCYGAVNELAKRLKKLSDNGKLITYKAMLEAAPAALTLEEAIDLAGQAVDFTVRQDIPSPEEYAKQALSKSSIPLSEELIAHANLYQYGQKLMEHNGVTQSGYGALIPLDGRSVEQCLDRPALGLSMEMR